MIRKVIRQKLWQSLQPLLPPVTRSHRGGRPRLDDKAALEGILFVLATRIPWDELPQELGFGSSMTCWRRLRDWQTQGIWDRLYLALLTQLRQCDQIDWSRVCIDGPASPAPGGPTHRQQPHRSRQIGQQAAPDRRPL